MSLLNPVHGSASYCITSRIGPLIPLQDNFPLYHSILLYPTPLHSIPHSLLSLLAHSLTAHRLHGCRPRCPCPPPISLAESPALRLASPTIHNYPPRGISALVSTSLSLSVTLHHPFQLTHMTELSTAQKRHSNIQYSGHPHSLIPSLIGSITPFSG